MKTPQHNPRRKFLQKISLGTLSLTALMGHNQNLFASDLADTESMPISGKLESDAKKFVPVMLTPFDSNLNIDFGTLTKLTDFYIACGAKGFFANCLSSEMYHLDNDERLALARHVVKQVNGKMQVVATGSFGETIEEKAEFTKKMYDTGVDAVILISSHFATKDEDDAVLISNLEKFLSLTGDIPLGTYECPSPYKRIISPEVMRFMVSSRRFTYHKDTSLDLDKIKAKLEIAKGSPMEFYDAHTPNTMYSLEMGAKGMSCIAGNLYPELFSWMCANATDPSKQADVKWLQSELTQADSIISQGYPISAKYFLQKRGVPIQPLSRSKNTPLTEEQKQALDQILGKLPLWNERLGIKLKS
ncbi:dihydrodipicolinate synthase family protein [Algoriphagus aestuariicola]|uniref:Dihydrodipicolinate synthase family protein n=1 Tax=Algoriphagus aestuariicola TaxID=1852016 RepID=A0ABS3BQR5_9BACT|nr:dihydrodipicolinate synthase family protein [Algoriphagus aestuariicola]MBN7800601.1 dihydrodipicolinate synthase family protein [Algoriphagus aestuariicola]